MPKRQRLFRLFYRLGFTPWDGHPLSKSLRELVESTSALPVGAALDLGCGTGDTSIYLAKHGWHVTGVDFVPKALEKAREKARIDNVAVNFVHGDVTRLGEAGIGADFQLILDSGCLHNLSGDDRDAYAREVNAVAAPDARLLIVAYGPGGSFGVPGIDRDEIQRRFTTGWTLLSDGPEPAAGQSRRTGALQHYLLQRRS